MRALLRLWFRLDVPVSRRAYALSGFGLMAFKFAVEAAVVHGINARWMSPVTYFNPLLAARQQALPDADVLLWVFAAWTLPFLWIGVSMTVRRAEDAGLTPALALLYFIPVVNYALMLVLCMLPPRERRLPLPQLRTPEAALSSGASHHLRSAMNGIALALLIALVMVAVSVGLFGSYGTTLFAAAPLVMGATSAFVFNRPTPRRAGETMLVAALAVLMAGGAILLFALEGVLCLLMAAPLAVAMALMGALLGRWLALTRPTLGRSPAALVLVLPLLAGVESPRSSEQIEVASHVDVDAPPERVWPHVVSFSDLPDEPTWPFRLGIAYPQRARIDGSGAGALRRCEFSTGPFLEPITTWDAPRRLAFDVASQPPPLHEWSPYRHVFARHLDGYLRVRRGEFRLEALPGGRTRLSGSTWYELDMAPRAYWSLWSGALIHSIHERVLRHVKRLAES